MKLYEHQQEAVDFLLANKRACLADDMGLGKSIEAAVAAAHVGDRLLVLCPTSVLWNWERELRTWAPGLGPPTVLMRANQAQSAVTIVSHGRLRNTSIRDLIKGWRGTVIVDESHEFRNASAQRTQALYNRRDPLFDTSARVWCLTGTPMPNNCSELWTMLRGLWPDDFPEDFITFRKRYCKVVFTQSGDNIKVVGNKRVPELRERMRGKILRRLKRNVLTLPPRRYEQIVLAPERMPHEIVDLSGQLSAACIEATRSAASPEEAFRSLLDVDDQMSRFRRYSGVAKIEPVVDLLGGELRSGLDKIVVFAHHTEVIEGIVAQLREGFGVTAVNSIVGATSAAGRQRAVDVFQKESWARVLVCQLQAGGVGITLTAATEALFVEMAWTPGTNAQAADRIYRIGQTQPCRVRFVALAGTVDEFIVDALQRKLEMQREILG